MAKDKNAALNADTMDEFLKAAGISTDGETEATHFLDTGFGPLNEIISGHPDKGVPNGRIVMIAGPSASGKTMIATQIMISCQQQGGFAGFIDHEMTFAGDLARTQGLEMDDKNKFIYQEGHSFERSLSTIFKVAEYIRARAIIEPDKPIVFVCDSLAAMTPKSKLEKDYEELTMNDHSALSRATSANFPKAVMQCRDLNVTIVFLNQIRKNISGYGPANTYPGGDSAYFYSSVVLDLSGTLVTTDDKEKTPLYRDIVAKVAKSKATMPGRKASWEFKFRDDGTGFFDVATSYLKHLRDIGAIKKAGPRIEWEGKSLFVSNVADLVNADPDGKTKLRAIHREFLAKGK